MAVFRIHKSQDFTVMSRHHLRNKELSLKAKGLLTLMLSLPEDWDYSVLGLASLSRDGKDAVMSTLDELKKHGYLTMTMSRDEMGHVGSWIYDVFEKPKTEIPDSEEPHSENPYTENPPQYNTNIFSTDNTKDLNNEDNSSRTKSTSKNISSSPKKEKKESFDLSFVNIAFEDIFNEWLDYKRSKNQMYKRQIDVEIAYRKLLEYSGNDPKIAQEIIESAILGNYMGFFAPKKQQNNYGNSSNSTSRNPWCDVADAITQAGGIL